MALLFKNPVNLEDTGVLRKPHISLHKSHAKKWSFHSQYGQENSYSH